MCEERQDEDVAVPEDVSSVARPESRVLLASRRRPSFVRWKRVKRIASCRSGSPSTTTSAVAQRRAGRAVLDEEVLETGLLRGRECGACRPLIGCVRRETVEPARPARVDERS